MLLSSLSESDGTEFNQLSRANVRGDTAVRCSPYNGIVATLTFFEARRTVLSTVRAGSPHRRSKGPARGRRRARARGSGPADRDSPALSRSVRDGFAVRAIDLPGELEVIGEVRAGAAIRGFRRAGPGGGDHDRRAGARGRRRGRDGGTHAARAGRVVIDRSARAAASSSIRRGAKRAPEKSCCTRAAARLHRRRRAGGVRARSVAVYRRPEVAIVATGDEIVEIDESPAEFQIRNSNAYSLAAQVARAGGVPEILPVARDTVEHTRERVREAAGSRPAAALRRRFGRQVRRGGGGARRVRRAVLFRPRAHPAGPAAGVRQRVAANSSSACRATPPPPW